jgi:hypothetical protein
MTFVGCERHQIFYESILGVCFSFLSVFFSRCRLSLFGFILSAARTLRHKTHWGRTSPFITTLVKPKDKEDSSNFRDFVLDIPGWLLQGTGSLLGLRFTPVKNFSITLLPAATPNQSFCRLTLISNEEDYWKTGLFSHVASRMVFAESTGGREV